MICKISLIIVMITLSAFAFNEEDFLNNVSTLDSIARRINLPVRVNFKPNCIKKLSMHENLGNYFDRAYTGRMNLAQRNKLGWIKAALIYRTLSKWQKSPLWQYLGESYYNVKLNIADNIEADVATMLDVEVSLKEEDIYLLYGQYSSLLLKLCERTYQGNFIINYLKALESNNLSSSAIFKQVMAEQISGYDNIDRWFFVEGEKYTVTYFNVMGSNFLRKKLDEILLIEVVSENAAGETWQHRLSDGLPSEEKLSKEVCNVILKHKQTQLQWLWFESPISARHIVEELQKIFSEVIEGNNTEFGSKITESYHQYMKVCQRQESIVRWLHNVELEVDAASSYIEPYRKIIKGTSSKISDYLDNFEDKLELLKK